MIKDKVRVSESKVYNEYTFNKLKFNKKHKII